MVISNTKIGDIILFGYENEYIFTQLKKGELYEQDILIQWKKYISNSSVIYDIGANLGNHTVFFAKTFDKSEIFSFEPIVKNFELLKKNCDVNECNNVKIFNIGIGEKDSKGIAKDDIDSNYGSIQVEFNPDGDIHIKSIDNMDLPNPQFIKIDVEGFEISVLRGMLKTIEISKPTIWIEVRVDTFIEVNKILTQLDYSIIEYSKFNVLYMYKGNSVINEKIFSDYLINLDNTWKYRESSMKNHSAYLYEKKLLVNSKNKNSDLENKNSDLENKNSDLENKNSDLENKNSDLENKNS
ncbi:MAG: FkbM family methyltransferase, partial [Peptostreptococcaceae bacterium]